MVDLITHVRAVRPDWTRTAVARAITDATRDRPLHLVAAVLLRLAADPDTRAPGRLNAVPDDYWTDAARTRPVPTPRREWCGQCDQSTRLVYADDGTKATATRCARCHPETAALVAA